MMFKRCLWMQAVHGRIRRVIQLRSDAICSYCARRSQTCSPCVAPLIASAQTRCQRLMARLAAVVGLSSIAKASSSQSMSTVCSGCNSDGACRTTLRAWHLVFHIRTTGQIIRYSKLFWAKKVANTPNWCWLHCCAAIEIQIVAS